MGRLERDAWELVFMTGAVAEKKAVDKIQSMALFLEECYGRSLDSNQANNVDFFARLASETGNSVEELKSCARSKLNGFSEHLSAALNILQSNPSEDSVVDCLTDVYQAGSSFYDNYGYLIQPECLDEFLRYLDTLGLVLDNLSSEFDVSYSLSEFCSSRKEDYNLDKLISAACG